MPDKHVNNTMPGLLILLSTGVALLAANSGFVDLYQKLINYQIDALGLAKPLQQWVNEFLMAFFFMAVTLEIRLELSTGHLATWEQRFLPLIAAIAGVVMPVLVFSLFNYHDASAMHGWAIPTVTDIAFAICIAGFFRKSLPPYLMVFLLSLAIFDDLIGICIIGFFYSDNIWLALLLADILAVVGLKLLSYFRTNWWSIALYCVLGLVLWYCTLLSGVHATIAGVIFASVVPRKLVGIMWARLEGWVNYLILPLFAFTNAGLNLHGFGLTELFSPLSLGIMLGLFVGKQLGVFVTSWLLLKTGIMRLPFAISWLQLYGISLLTGIGFTVSMFVGDLAFGSAIAIETAKLAVIIGSLLSAVAGFVVLRHAELVSASQAARDHEISSG